MKIFLIGYRGSGKTSTGKILAKLLHGIFVDTDQEVEKTWRVSIADMVKAHGWEEFRKREKEILARIVRKDPPKDYQVVATGGGIVLDSANRDMIRASGLAVLLQADAQTLVKRIVQDEERLKSRPRFHNEISLLAETVLALETRQKFYMECASLIVDTTNHDPETVAGQIQEQIGKGSYK